MARVRKNKSDPLAGLPQWGQKLAQRYYTKTVSTFIVYGSVRDLQPTTAEDGTLWKNIVHRRSGIPGLNYEMKPRVHRTVNRMVHPGMNVSGVVAASVITLMSSSRALR